MNPELRTGLRCQPANDLTQVWLSMALFAATTRLSECLCVSSSTASGNIPLMRVVQSIKHTKKAGKNVIHEGWMLHCTNRDSTVTNSPGLSWLRVASVLLWRNRLLASYRATSSCRLFCFLLHLLSFLLFSYPVFHLSLIFFPNSDLNHSLSGLSDKTVPAAVLI